MADDECWDVGLELCAIYDKGKLNKDKSLFNLVRNVCRKFICKKCCSHLCITHFRLKKILRLVEAQALQIADDGQVEIVFASGG